MALSRISAAMVAFVQRLVGAVQRTVADKLGERVSVKDFGAKGDGTTDDTAAFAKAVAWGTANGGTLYIPYGIYNVDRIYIKDAVYTFQVHCDSALFVGTATVPRGGLLELVNCVDFTMSGSYHWLVQNNENYDVGVCVRAELGTSQSTSRLNLYNMTVRNARVAFGIGRYNVDYQCSEINLFGCNAFRCPTFLYGGGSQTGGSLNGCNLVSEKNPDIASAVDRVIWLEGGFWTVSGGSIAFAETASATAILLNPCQSATYGNPYPILRIVGAHIETQSQLIALVNNRGLPAPDSSVSSIAIIGCGGYVSGAAAAQDFIYIGDASYAGRVAVRGSNFYSGAVRTAYNISSASPAVVIDVDSSSFGKNFRDWLGGIYNGVVQHAMVPVVYATGINATLGAGEQLLKFQNISTDGKYARYGVWYGNGSWIVRNGIKEAHIEVNLVGGNGAVGNGDFYLKKNGSIVAFGQYAAGIARLSTTLRNLAVGDVITAHVAGAQANTFDNATYQHFVVTATTM